MRGKPISVAAIYADILSRTLVCSVKVEILGSLLNTGKVGLAENWDEE